MSTLIVTDQLLAFETYVNSFSASSFTPITAPLDSALAGTISYKEISTAEVVAEGAGGFIVIDGQSLSLPIGAAMNGSVSDLSWNSLGGTVQQIRVYQGGSFQNGVISGGSQILNATLSSSQYSVTEGSSNLTLSGSNLPTSAATIAAILKGTYTGPAIGITSLSFTLAGTTATVALSATSYTLTLGDYEIVLSGTDLPTSLNASFLDAWALKEKTSLPGSFDDITVTQISTGDVILSESGITNPVALSSLFDGGSVDPLSGLLANVSTFQGSAADISSQLDRLETLAGSGIHPTIEITDSGIPTLSITATQLYFDKPALGDISGNFTLLVTAVPSAEQLSGLAGHATTLELKGDADLYSFKSGGNGSSLTATAQGQTYYLSSITALQFQDQTDLVAATPGSGQVTTGNITELYSAVLAREPDIAGLAFYQTYLKSNPNTPLLQFAEWFLSSQEYTSNSGHNYAQTSAGDAQFITDSYENLLHRTPSAAEIAYYQTNVMAPALAGLTAGTQAYSNAEFQAHAQMLVYFSASSEFLSDVQVTAAHPSDAQHWLILV